MTSSPPLGTLSADEALEELYATHYRRLVRLGVLLLHDQAVAEEAVQDAFIALHGRWRSLRDPERAAAYLRSSVVNGARSRLRRRGTEERYAERQTVQLVAPGADEGALAGERRRGVLAALQQLPERQREVLVLRHYLDLDEATIAETLGISRGSVKTHASRGAATLRTLLEELR